MTKSAGGSSYPYTYKEDPKGRLTEIDNPFGQTFRLYYDKNGNMVTKSFPNGETDVYSYDAMDRISEIDYFEPGQENPRQTLQYPRLANGLIMLEINGSSSDRSRSFIDDNLGRLASESRPWASPVETNSYTYDKDGNRLTKTVSGSENYTDYYGYDLANHDPDKLTWINRGTNAEPQSGSSSIHSRYAYDAAGKLASLERRYEDGTLATRTFGYGMLDQMISETSAAGNVTSYYDVYGNRTSEYDSLRDASAPQKANWGPEGIYRQDVHGATSGYNVYTEGLAHRFYPSGASAYDLYYHLDATGSVRYLTDANGAVTSARDYDAYGEATVETGSANPTPFGWEGGYGYQGSYVPDSGHGLGLYDVGLRQYDAQAGRFTTPDLIGLAGGLNRYLYAGSDPVNFADPSGMAVRAPGLWESFIPIWGSGRQALNDFGCGHWGRGLFDSAMAISDVFLAKSIATAAFKGVAKLAGTEAVEEAIKGACFPAGTLVDGKDGKKPIEAVKVGDRVLSWDPATGRQNYEPVTRTFVRHSDSLLTVTMADGRSVETTPDHPFWTEGKGFVLAKNLARSDLLADSEGNRVAIARVTERHGAFEVYNLEVAGAHTYYAGDWLVHNKAFINGEIAESRNIVYRALAEGEDPSLGLFARAPDADVSPLSHVAGKIRSNWISTTKDINVALGKYDNFGVVSIDLSKVFSEIVDISEGISGGGRFSNYAKSDLEVLIRGFVSPEAITIIK